MMRKTRTRKIELLYKTVGSNDRDKAWKFWKILSLVPRPCTTCVGWAWDHGFEMCALVLHTWVGHGTIGLKCVPLYYTRGLGMGPWVWNVCPGTTCVGRAWDHGFEMCALVLHARVGHGTMGLKCVPLYYMRGSGMGPWVWNVPLYYMRGSGMGPWVWNVCPCTTCLGWAWDHGFEMCESTSYIIRRVDATSFRSLFLIISTLVVGESWRLGPLPIWR